MAACHKGDNKRDLCRTANVVKRFPRGWTVDNETKTSRPFAPPPTYGFVHMAGPWRQIHRLSFLVRPAVLEFAGIVARRNPRKVLARGLRCEFGVGRQSEKADLCFAVTSFRIKAFPYAMSDFPHLDHIAGFRPASLGQLHHFPCDVTPCFRGTSRACSSRVGDLSVVVLIIVIMSSRACFWCQTQSFRYITAKHASPSDDWNLDTSRRHFYC